MSAVAPCVGAWIETILSHRCNNIAAVAPCVGAWIETLPPPTSTTSSKVAPCVGAWIETHAWAIMSRCGWSLPAWERGLKHNRSPETERGHRVAPCVGAWIETLLNPLFSQTCFKSLPAWERGLKHTRVILGIGLLSRRSLRGSVD